MKKRHLPFLICAVLLLGSLVSTVLASFEIDLTATVTHVADGDTFDISTGDTIRLADIDAPEYNQPGGSEATAYLTSLIAGKTVYLDIDDITRTDQYGRLVCVVYIDYNSTHLENVNQAMLEAGHAEIWNFTNNEFNPYTWTLYQPITQVPELPPNLILPLLITLTLIAAIALNKKVEAQRNLQGDKPQNHIEG